jgi:hydrogenase maturation factor
MLVHLGEEVEVIRKLGEMEPLVAVSEGTLTHAVPATASTS